MSETTEKKLPVRNLERISEKKYGSYEAAAAGRQQVISADGPAPAKVKIFARYDGTFDVVSYRTIAKEAPKKAAKAPETTSEVPEKKVHGLRTKDRKKSPKKAQ